MEIPTYYFAIREDLEDTKDLFLPKQGDSESTGYDVRAAQHDRNPIILRAGQYFKLPLGFRVFCPEGWWYQLHPRSSSFLKKSMHSLIGIIDETYPNETCLVFQYLPDISSLCSDLTINFGDAVGQIIPVKRQLMNIELVTNDNYEDKILNRNAVRKGGFGSTGQ